MAFTTSPDSIPQLYIIPNDEDADINEVLWYTPVHGRQNEQSNKRVCFSKSMKPPKPILNETPKIELKLVMNILF